MDGAVGLRFPPLDPPNKHVGRLIRPVFFINLPTVQQARIFEGMAVEFLKHRHRQHRAGQLPKFWREEPLRSLKRRTRNQKSSFQRLDPRVAQTPMLGLPLVSRGTTKNRRPGNQALRYLRARFPSTSSGQARANAWNDTVGEGLSACEGRLKLKPPWG